MALPKIDEARALGTEELKEEIAAVKKQLFDLRFQKATRQLETTHEFKHKRHQLAQLLTVERERERELESDNVADPQENVESES